MPQAETSAGRMITAGTRATARNALRIQSLNKGQSASGDILNRWPPARFLLPPVAVLVRVGLSARCQMLLHTFVNLIAPNRFGSDAVIDLGRFPAMTSRSRTAGGTSAAACKAAMQDPQGTRWRALHHAFSVQWKMETHHPDDSLIPRLSTNTQSPNPYRLGFFLPVSPVKTAMTSRASLRRRRDFPPDSPKFLCLLSVGMRALGSTGVP